MTEWFRHFARLLFSRTFAKITTFAKISVFTVVSKCRQTALIIDKTSFLYDIKSMDSQFYLAILYETFHHNILGINGLIKLNFSHSYGDINTTL